ncbi:MAG TPA: hypothetical protein VJW76_02730 [Verrucomicrobiae bacterium]|nr:hypothetical protein [Verrucomicrobiae bacterium]
MQILVQNAESSKYFKGDNEWIQSADEALDFEDVPSAIEYCRKHNLSGVQVIVRSNDGSDDLRLQVY